ncbi:MAG TPA: hypothetical protein VF788_19210, partial [Pseudonocardiaceae bacterium]
PQRATGPMSSDTGAARSSAVLGDGQQHDRVFGGLQSMDRRRDWQEVALPAMPGIASAVQTNPAAQEGKTTLRLRHTYRVIRGRAG